MKTIGLLGYGNMGRTHAQNLAALPDAFQICGVYDPDSAACARAQADGLHVFDSMDALLRSPAELCLIAVPNDLHKALSIACMAAGKHVICEKPAALNTEELVEMLSAARLYGRVFTVDQNRRWDRDFLLMKALFERGSLGTPIFLDSCVQGSHGLPDNWLSQRGVGGMLMDWGVHLIDQLLCMIPGEVTQVYSQMVMLPGKECEENARVLLSFSGGQRAQIRVDTRCFCRLPRWYAMFERGTAVIPGVGGNCWIYEQGDANSVVRDGYSTGSGPSRTLAPSEDVVCRAFDLPVDDSFVQRFYSNVADAIDGKAALYVQPQQVLRVLRLLDAARQSEQQGCAIRCAL